MIRVGTDCSGIEAPIQALKKLGINFRHLFSSEIDKHAIMSIKANYNPEVLFEDMTKNRSVPDLDIYVCGFCCQPHSCAGKRQGYNDKRANIFDYCVKTIIETKTKIFILENVKGILSSNNGDYWKHVLKSLEEIKGYNIYYKLLNTKDYGIPQNRPRVYIIGIKKDIQFCEFKFPEKKEMKSLETIIDSGDTSISKFPCNKPEILERIKNSKATFLSTEERNLLRINDESYENYGPCITRSCYYYNIRMKRKASVKELLRLQAFPDDFKQVVSYTQMKRQIGNSMSVNILEELFKEIFKCTSLV